MRRSLVAGNWKMNGTPEGVTELLRGVLEGASDASQTEIVVCPPYVFLSAVARQLADSAVALGAQNVCDQDEGAYTGEISVSMLVALGCSHVIIGHSERRALYGESDEFVARKLVQAQGAGLTPIVCLGETLDERDAGTTEAVVGRQLDAVIDCAGAAALEHAVVAYEPVWAIGTGKTASPEQANDVHAFVRQRVASHQQAVAEGLRILYGGSVKPDNAHDLFEQPDIDGGLIGGASLKADDFLAICRATQ